MHRMEALAHKGSIFISAIRKLMAKKLPNLVVGGVVTPPRGPRW